MIFFPHLGMGLEVVARGVDNLRSWIPNKAVHCYIETTRFDSGSVAGPSPADTEFQVI